MIIDKNLKSIFPPDARYWELDWLCQLENKENVFRRILLISVLVVSVLVCIALFVFFAFRLSIVKKDLIIYGIFHCIILCTAILSNKIDISELLYLILLFSSFITNLFLPVFEYFYIIPLFILPIAGYLFRNQKQGLIICILTLLTFNSFYALYLIYPSLQQQNHIGIKLYFILNSCYIFECCLLLLREHISHIERVSLFWSRLYDETTNLPKRYLINHIVQPSSYVHIAILSIKNLSHIGIIMGYDFLTKVTLDIANILKENKSKLGFQLFRLTKGEFGIILEGEDPEQLKTSGRSILNELTLQIKNMKITNGDLFIYVEIDIGAAIGKADQISGILSKADQIKIDSHNYADDHRPFIVESDIRKRFIEDQRKYDVLLSNLINNSMEVHFQPVVNLSTGKLFFHESLLRLRDENGRLVSVWEYLDVAKKTGLYTQLTIFVMETVFKKIETTDDVCFSLNISLTDIENFMISEFLFEHQDYLKNNCNRIIFEITESEISTNSSEMLTFLEFARDINIKIAIDDFGSGYSNFTRLSDFPPYLCKIDGKLFQRAFSDDLSSKVLEGIISLCKNIDVHTVAEYIETEDQKMYAKRIKVDFGQGYLFSKPKPELQ